jgi:hypothetical protein
VERASSRLARLDPFGTPAYAVETAAAWPMFGQYVAHDMTADRSPIAPQARLA